MFEVSVKFRTLMDRPNVNGVVTRFFEDPMNRELAGLGLAEVTHWAPAEIDFSVSMDMELEWDEHDPEEVKDYVADLLEKNFGRIEIDEMWAREKGAR